MVTAERKWKKLASGEVVSYIYYHCTHRKNPDCAQGSIEEKELEKQVARELEKLEIPADFAAWALARLKEMHAKEIVDRKQIYGNQRREYEASVRKIDALIDMRANGEIDEQEFKRRKAAALADKERSQGLLNDTDRRVEHWLEVAERGFDFAEKAREVFERARETDNVELKKEIFTALGSNYRLKDGILSISLDDLLFPIREAAKEARAVSKRLEPEKKPVSADYLSDLYDQSPSLLRD